MKILLIIILAIVILIVVLYNYLVKLNIRCKNAWSQIDNQLKRRADLIPNLVEVTKGYAAYESQVLVDVVNARNQANSMSDLAKNTEEVSNNLKSLLALGENYPDLKSSDNFKQLSDELAGTENRISVARKDYNDAVNTFNTTIKRFPNNIVAGMFGFEKATYFKADEKSQEVPSVNFE